MLTNTNSPILMGILNVTPDSFSDGGKFIHTRHAIKHAEAMISAGATIIDVGGESSRPGAKAISIVEELQRVVPVIKALVKKQRTWKISIDTYKPEVAAIALALGVDIVNDISGLRDPLMRQVVAQAQCPVVVMHMLGTPGTMQKHPRYKNIVADIISFFKIQIDVVKGSGIKPSNIILDPGIGFGKTVQHNLEILQNLKKIKRAFPKHQLLIGASRKSFIGKLTGTEIKTDDRLAGTLAVHLWAAEQGADILRVHDVAEHAQALTIQHLLQI